MCRTIKDLRKEMVEVLYQENSELCSHNVSISLRGSEGRKGASCVDVRLHADG